MTRVVLTLLLLVSLLGDIRAEEWRGDHLLRALYDRADLVIEATVTEDCEGGMGSGPIPNDEAQVAFLELILRVKVDRVLKGNAPGDHPFLIAVTIPWIQPPVGLLTPITTPLSAGDDEMKFSKQGDRYLFFLEDRPKREPKSHHASNGEVIRFRSFDTWFARLPVTEEMVIRLAQWQKAAEQNR